MLSMNHIHTYEDPTLYNGWQLLAVLAKAGRAVTAAKLNDSGVLQETIKIKGV